MNIENNKISGRQLGRLIFYDFFALTTLLLPGMLAKEVGMDGFFVLAAGCAAGYGLLLLVLVLIRRMRQAEQDYYMYLLEHFGKLLTIAILFIYLLTALFGAAYGLRFLCDITRQYLIRDTPAWLVLAVIALLAVYGLCAGLESRGRMYEILFWFVLLPIFFLFFLAVRNVEPDRWVPVFRAEGISFMKNSYLVFAFFMSSAFLPMFTEGVSEHADVPRVLKQGFVFSVCVNLALFLVLTGIFGAPTVATMEEAVLTLTALVKVPGGFLERQDALLCGIWLVSVFAFVENALYYAVWCLKKISRKKESGWLLPGAGVFVYVLALCMYRSERFTSQLSRVYLRIAVPVLVGILLVAWILSVWRNKKQPWREQVPKEDASR
ncbi:MAG: endospore germination permease [Eubacterium sp.]|nr:endospore germination permease [Eubacterium sp.]